MPALIAPTRVFVRFSALIRELSVFAASVFLKALIIIFDCDFVSFLVALVDLERILIVGQKFMKTKKCSHIS